MFLLFESREDAPTNTFVNIFRFIKNLRNCTSHLHFHLMDIRVDGSHQLVVESPLTIMPSHLVVLEL